MKQGFLCHQGGSLDPGYIAMVIDAEPLTWVMLFSVSDGGFRLCQIQLVTLSMLRSAPLLF